MDDIKASIGIVQLDKLKNDIKERAKVRQYYENQLAGINDIIVPFINREGFCSNYIFPIVLKNSNATKRDQIRQMLHEKGIQTSVHYPAVHRFYIYRKYKTKLPITEYVSDNLITLPMYSKLSEKNVIYIISSIKEILQS